MGLIKAGFGAAAGVLADQWREYFYCEALSTDVLVSKGYKRVNEKRSSNTKASDNIITNGSIVAVNDGQFMMIVEQGKVVESVEGPYGEEGTIVQEFYPLPKFGDSYTLIGSWLINDQPAGIGIREDRALITKDLSRFYPHIFVE